MNPIVNVFLAALILSSSISAQGHVHAAEETGIPPQGDHEHTLGQNGLPLHAGDPKGPNRHAGHLHPQGQPDVLRQAPRHGFDGPGPRPGPHGPAPIGAGPAPFFSPENFANNEIIQTQAKCSCYVATSGSNFTKLSFPETTESQISGIRCGPFIMSLCRAQCFARANNASYQLATKSVELSGVGVQLQQFICDLYSQNNQDNTTQAIITSEVTCNEQTQGFQTSNSRTEVFPLAAKDCPRIASINNIAAPLVTRVSP